MLGSIKLPPAARTAAIVIYATVEQIDVVVLPQTVEFDVVVSTDGGGDVAIDLAGSARGKGRELINATAVDGDL